MQLYKGFVQTKDKRCLTPFKNATSDELLSLEQVKNLPEYAGILSDETILVDVDDIEQSVVLLNIFYTKIQSWSKVTVPKQPWRLALKPI